MLNIVIGNVLTVIAACFSTINGTRKNKKEMLWCDAGSAFFFTLADVFLKGYSGLVQNAVGVVRDLFALFLPDLKYSKWILLAAGVILGIYFNNRGFFGLLPVITAFYYSLCALDKNCSAEKFKVALVLNCTAYVVYDLILSNYVGMVLDSITDITTIVYLINYYSHKTEQSKNN